MSYSDYLSQANVFHEDACNNSPSVVSVALASTRHRIPFAIKSENDQEDHKFWRWINCFVNIIPTI